MTDRSTSPRCGLDPRAQLTDGDRQAVDSFRAYLADRAAPRQHAEAALAAVEAALGDTLVPAAREEALAGIVAVLPPPADRAADEIARLRTMYDAATARENDLIEERDQLRETSADRAAVLREAAQRLYTALFPAVYADMGQKAAEGVNRAVSELRRMADETATTEAAEQLPVCEGFVWIGQSFAICDRCGQPAWEHAGEDVPVDGAGPFDTRRTVRPWKPGQADAMRVKWGQPAAGARQAGAQP